MSAEDEDEKVTWGVRLRSWAWQAFTLVAGLMVLLPLVGWLRAPSLPDQAPAFALQTLGGETVSLDAFRGQTVVLNFWATWCGPCRAEIPAFNRFATDHPDVPVLGIVQDGPASKVRHFAGQHGMTYEVLMGDPQVFQDYQVSMYPTTVIVGPDGGIEHAHAGIMYGAYLRWLTGHIW